MNSATISGVPFPGHTLGEGSTFSSRRRKEIFPAGYTYDFQGDSRQLVQEGNTLLITFVFSLIVIFLVLAAQFESFRDPFIILIALPTSMFGALLPLNILGVLGAESINIYTADRARDVDRADFQARHLDGRIRQPLAGRAGHVSSRRDRECCGACGCARS